MKYLLLFSLLFLNLLKAEIVFDDNMPPSKEILMDYDSIPDDSEVINPKELEKDTSQILKDVDSLQKKETLKQPISSNNLFLNFINPPKKALLNQRIKIELKATIARDDVKNLSIDFKNSDDFQIFNPKREWKKIDENRFLKTIYIKFKKITKKTPSIKVTVEFQKGFKNTITIKVPPISIVKLASNRLFCGVIADNLEILNHSEKRFDDNSNIVLLEINATNSNLEDFYIPYAKKSGVDEYKDSGEFQKIFGYALIERDVKVFKFKYFNTKTNRYELKSFNIILKDQTLSTQTDLNPKKNRYQLYKSIVLAILAALFFIFSLKNRSIFLLFIAVVLAIYVAYSNFPMKKIILQKGVGLKILPTKNSTIFYIVPKDTKVDVVYERKGYYKVILPNQKIGWVKKSD